MDRLRDVVPLTAEIHDFVWEPLCQLGELGLYNSTDVCLLWLLSVQESYKVRRLAYVVLNKPLAEDLVDDGFAKEDPSRITHPAILNQHLHRKPSAHGTSQRTY